MTKEVSCKDKSVVGVSSTLMKLRSMRCGPAVAAFAFSLLVPSLGAAADPEAVYVAALADFQAGNYASACPKFAEARRLKPDASAPLLGLAQCYEKAGKTASAWSKYRELAVELRTRGDAARADAAAARADELAKTLSTITVTPAAPATPGLVIKLDQEDVARAMFGSRIQVDPGVHVIDAAAPGFEPWHTTITVGDRGDVKAVVVPALSPAKQAANAASADSHGSSWGTQRIAGVAVGSAGVAGLIVGAVFGGLTAKKVSDSKSSCNAEGTACFEPGYSLRRDAKTTANVSNVAFAIGGAALVAGVVMFVTAPRAGAPMKSGSASVRVAVSASPEMAGVMLTGGF
ncbi:Hypothetical protein A7982_03477 [Minicystis rosea]|nr:Hypothetical protein A7982_03477 [Minicystis rosea]